MRTFTTVISQVQSRHVSNYLSIFSTDDTHDILNNILNMSRDDYISRYDFKINVSDY